MGEDVRNEFCPVLPEEPVSSKHSVDYEGVKVYLCCDDCRSEFEENPGLYVENLPAEIRDAVAGSRQGSGRWLAVVAGAVALVLLALLLRHRLRARREGSSSRGRQRIALILFVLLAGQTAVIVVLSFWVVLYHRKITDLVYEDHVHFATYHDFGEPPIPWKPPLSERVSGVYYRGNDERSPLLENGGHYRTATFSVSLRRGGGEPVEHDQDVGGEALEVRLEIERAPFTPDFFWTPERMGRFFATRQSAPFLGRYGPVSDRTPLATLEPMERWRLTYPIGSVDPEEAALKKGVVYIAEDIFKDGAVLGARFHYAIQYDLAFEDGVVTSGSDLWMGALYRTRKVRQPLIPLSEWFSHEPIPELTRPGTKDSDLLGIDDYESDGR